MWILPVVAVVVATGLALRHPGALPVAGPVIVLWMLAPATSWWLSQPIRPSRSGLSPEDLAFLRTVARRTWRFFETFVGPDDNDLPPDNFQEDPPQGIAHRTSPTNIGLSLLANLAAYDFGYVPAGERDPPDEAVLGVDGTDAAIPGTLLQLVRHQNLGAAASALRFDGGQRELGRVPHHARRRSPRVGESEDLQRGRRLSRGWQLRSTSSPRWLGPHLPTCFQPWLGCAQPLGAVPRTLSGSRVLLAAMLEGAGELERLVDLRPDDETSWWVDAFATQCRRWLEELDHLAPWVVLPAHRSRTGWDG